MAVRPGKDEISSINFKYRGNRRYDHWHHVWLRSHGAGTDSTHQYRGNLPSGRSCDGWPDGWEHNRAGSQCVPRVEQKAREQIIKDQATYSSADKRRCMRTGVYLPSYVEWLTCLEMERDVRKMRGEELPATDTMTLPRVRPRTSY